MGGGEGSSLMRGVADDFLGPAPSTDEVHHAVSDLKLFVKDKFSYDVEKETENEISIGPALLQLVASAGSEFGSRALKPHGPSRVCDPSHMLQNNRAVQKTDLVQKMVTSLSSDEAFWHAVSNNEAVQELCMAYISDEDFQSNSENPDATSSANTEHNPATNFLSDEDFQSNSENADVTGSANTEHNPTTNFLSDEDFQSNSENPDATSYANTEYNPATNVIKWIFENTKAGVTGLVEKILQLANHLFKPHDEKTTGGPSSLFEEKLRTIVPLVKKFKLHDEKTTAGPSSPCKEELIFYIVLSVMAVLIVMVNRVRELLRMIRVVYSILKAWP